MIDDGDLFISGSQEFADLILEVPFEIFMNFLFERVETCSGLEAVLANKVANIL